MDQPKITVKVTTESSKSSRSKKSKKPPLAKRIPPPPKNKGKLNLSEEEKERRRAQLMAVAAAKLKTKILEARADPGKFIELVFRDQKGEKLKLQSFHWDWLAILQKHRRVQIEAARSHGKTTIVLGYILWCIGNDPSIRIKLFTQSEEKARERLTVIGDMITTNKLVKLVFPDLRPAKRGVWHKTAIQVERAAVGSKDPTLEASGIMGSVEGGRADLIVFDDICDFRTSIVYPQHREAIKKKVYAEIMPMLEEDGSAVSIATPHHEMDAVASLRNNREWKSYVFAVGAPDDPFLPLWPSRWPRKALEKLRNEIGPIEYDRAYRCKSVSSATQIVQPEHIQFYTAEMLPDPWGLICIQAYDLAGTTKKKSSYFACVTILYDSEANVIYVADAYHAKLSFADQAAAIVAGAAKWQPDRIVIEQTGYQSALREYLLELAEEPLPIVAMTPGSKSKELRLTETLPMFEAGRIFFNPSLDPGPNPDRSVKGDIIGQLLDFAQAQDQDMGDAFAYGVKMCRAFRLEEDDDDWAGGDGVSTRMSIIGM